MIEYKIATNDDIELLMSSRLEMLRVVNGLSDDYVYSDEIVRESRDYFLNGDHLTVLAIDGGEVISRLSNQTRNKTKGKIHSIWHPIKIM